MNIEYGLCYVENEGRASKMVEGRLAKTYEIYVEILYNNCEDNDKCFTVCPKKNGYLTHGVCNYKKECVCSQLM